MRIALACEFFYPRVGGVETHIFSLAQELLKLGHKVIVISGTFHERQGKYFGFFSKD